MAGSDVGTTRAPGAAECSRNSDDAPSNKETTIRAPETTTPLTGESLDIAGSLDQLCLDSLEGGNVRPIFTKTMVASGPIRNRHLAFPYQDQEAD
jgi:hypothetical protein